MVQDRYWRMQIFLEKAFFQDRCHQKFGNQYSFHALCLSRGQQAPYGGRGCQISNKRRCIDNGGALWGTSRVRAAPPARQPCLNVLQRLPIPSIRGTSRELSLWELGA